MTREEARKAAEVMLAFANGEEIEYKPRCGNGQWIKFTASNFNWITNEYRIKPKEKFDPRTLKPFDKVLVKVGYDEHHIWYADFVCVPITDNITGYCIMSNIHTNAVIPYNDDTKHLVGTSDDAPKYYKYWEE